LSNSDTLTVPKEGDKQCTQLQQIGRLTK